jgi:RNA polymerase sigma-70 factor (ECF subfamily)
VELGQRFAMGEEDVLSELIACYGKKLLRYAVSMLYNHQDAEDVVQDVFISAYQSRAGFDGKNLSAWLYKITYNHSLNMKKKRKPLFFSDISEEPAVYMDDNISMPEIMEALKPLKPQERALLYGRVVNGHSYEELSQIMGATPAALRKQYERVKKKAARYLDAFEEADYRIPLAVGCKERRQLR